MNILLEAALFTFVCFLVGMGAEVILEAL